MRKLYLFDIGFYIIIALVITGVMTLVFHASQWVIDGVVLGIVVAAVNGVNRRIESRFEGVDDYLLCFKSHESTGESDYDKAADVMKQIETICMDNGFSVMIPIQRKKKVEQNNTIEE